MAFDRKNPQKDPLGKALQLSSKGQIKAATHLLKKALLRPKELKNPLACARNLGFFLLQNGKEASFLSWIQGSGLTWRDDPFLLLLQGKAFFRQEDYKRAEASYQKVLRDSKARNPWKQQAQEDLKALLKALDEIHQAKGALNRARLLIGGGTAILILFVGISLIILKRMERRLAKKEFKG